MNEPLVRTLAACAAFAAIANCALAETYAPLLHPLFQDHAVLQREQPIRVWGRARPGAEVQLELAATTARARAAADGDWQTELPALPAGGPYTLTARSDGVQQAVSDVLVGDVWLCSGQSNMELQVWRTLDARAEIAAAGNDRIRVFSVPQVAAVAPQAQFSRPVQWRPADGDSIRDFSAACYYFARELRKHVDVPIGLVNASWGGSRIQAWTSGAALRTLGAYDGELDVLDAYARDAPSAVATWGKRWQRWWSQRPGIAAGDAPWRAGKPSGDWAEAPVGLGAWERWGVPELADFDGMLWYRATVRLDAAQAAQPAVLELGPVDEIDMTWVNGRGVGSSYGAGSGRAYALPAGLLHKGENVVVVNVLDTYRDGGLAGPASLHAVRLADGSRVPLEGWRYRRVPKAVGAPPRAPWQSAAGLSTLHNGMIAPLGHVGLRGALWYQGESNTFEHDRYASLLRTLRTDWRARFGARLPLLVVQLANFGMPPSRPSESDWAALREAQREVAADDEASALVVAIDIGDRYDIHPPNKQELGRRIARAARHAAYGEPLSPSGPVPRSARRDGESIELAFDGVEGRLVALGADGPIGFEVCGAAADSCHYAAAEVDATRVRLHVGDARAVTRVRHCWADGPVCTLYDAAGLPAGPFEIAVSP